MTSAMGYRCSRRARLFFGANRLFRPRGAAIRYPPRPMARFFASSLLVLLLSACATTNPSTSQPSGGNLPLWAGLAPGQYPVGLISSTVVADPHPLQITIWYPAGTDGKQLHYRDYLTLNLSELASGAPTVEQRQ